ncbi:hypothetical protein HaLaN_16310, partial [Haematococcus lacustris]
MKQKSPHMPGARAAALRCRLIMAQQDGLRKTLQIHSRQVLELQDPFKTHTPTQHTHTLLCHYCTPDFILHT